MKKRVFIALAAVMSVTLAAVCTAGVLARTTIEESTKTAPTAPAGDTASQSAKTEETTPEWEQIRKAAQQKAENVCFCPADETMLALADEIASGYPSVERMAAIRKELDGTRFSEHLEYSLGGFGTRFGYSAEDWLHDFILYFYDSETEAEKEYRSDLSKAFFDDVCEGLCSRYEGITDQQVRTIFLRRLFDVSSPYSEAVLVGLTDSSAPKLTPEAAKELISSSDGTVEEILEKFRTVQPYADVGNTVEDLRKEKALVIGSSNLRDTTPRFGSCYQFVTKDADGVYHSVIVGDMNTVYYNRYDGSGNLLSSECLAQPDASADPLSEVRGLKLSDFRSDSTWGA